MALPMEDLGREVIDGKSGPVDILLYGATGAGKTYLGATAPKVYVATADPTGHRAIPTKVKGTIIRKTDDLREVIKGFMEGGHGFKSLLVDGFSFLHDLYVRETGWMYHNERGAKDPDLMPLQGRLKIQQQIKALLRTLVDLTQHPNEKDRVHVIVTTLEERLKESDEAPFAVRPIIGTKAMNETFSAVFSVQGRVTAKGGIKEDGGPNVDRRVIFTPQGGIETKDRVGVFPLIWDPVTSLSDFLL